MQLAFPDTSMSRAVESLGLLTYKDCPSSYRQKMPWAELGTEMDLFPSDKQLLCVSLRRMQILTSPTCGQIHPGNPGEASLPFSSANQEQVPGIFLAVVVKTVCFHSGGTGSIPGRGTKSPYTSGQLSL